MICKNYIPVETRLIASLQRADSTNDLRVLYNLSSLKIITYRAVPETILIPLRVYICIDLLFLTYTVVKDSEVYGVQAIHF
ncbi:hypothetical protein RIVM261_041070 [Rivularia sp. IAM M-261]|nr:hypothetical protein RIVM261_041070 [Rivularia sp. IAM M-261]